MATLYIQSDFAYWLIWLVTKLRLVGKEFLLVCTEDDKVDIVL